MNVTNCTITMFACLASAMPVFWLGYLVIYIFMHKWGVLAGYWGGYWDTSITYLSNLVNLFHRLALILLMIAAFKPDIYYIMAVIY